MGDVTTAEALFRCNTDKHWPSDTKTPPNCLCGQGFLDTGDYCLSQDWIIGLAGGLGGFIILVLLAIVIGCCVEAFCLGGKEKDKDDKEIELGQTKINTTHTGSGSMAQSEQVRTTMHQQDTGSPTGVRESDPYYPPLQPNTQLPDMDHRQEAQIFADVTSGPDQRITKASARYVQQQPPYQQQQPAYLQQQPPYQQQQPPYQQQQPAYQQQQPPYQQQLPSPSDYRQGPQDYRQGPGTTPGPVAADKQIPPNVPAGRDKFVYPDIKPTPAADYEPSDSGVDEAPTGSPQQDEYYNEDLKRKGRDGDSRRPAQHIQTESLYDDTLPTSGGPQIDSLYDDTIPLANPGARDRYSKGQDNAGYNSPRDRKTNPYERGTVYEPEPGLTSEELYDDIEQFTDNNRTRKPYDPDKTNYSNLTPSLKIKKENLRSELVHVLAKPGNKPQSPRQNKYHNYEDEKF